MMVLLNLDIGDSTGLTVWEVELKKLLFERCLQDGNLDMYGRAQNITHHIAGFKHRELLVVSEKFLASRTMHKKVFEAAQVAAMVQFYCTRNNIPFHEQVPQARTVFVATARSLVTTKPCDGKVHVADSLAHGLVWVKNNLDSKYHMDLKKKGERRKLKIEDYEGGFTF